MPFCGGRVSSKLLSYSGLGIVAMLLSAALAGLHLAVGSALSSAFNSCRKRTHGARTNV
jgi:hypothetical protein